MAQKGSRTRTAGPQYENVREEGLTQTALGVDTQNPSGALQLYESMGYKVISQSTVYRKSL